MSNSNPLIKQGLSSRLRRCVAAGLEPRRFSSHSRVGAASLAAQIGKSVAEIMALGRWSSTSYLPYIRSLEPLKAHQSISLRCPGASSSLRAPGARRSPLLSAPADRKSLPTLGPSEVGGGLPAKTLHGPSTRRREECSLTQDHRSYDQVKLNYSF